MRIPPLVTLAGLLLVNTAAVAQEAPRPSPAPPAGAPQRPPEVLKTFDKFPDEITHEGVRLYDFEFDPQPNSTIHAGLRVVLRFKYQVDEPRRLFVGAMPITKGNHSGGFQPFGLTGKEGTGQVGVIYHGQGGYDAPPPPMEIGTLAELKASYLHPDQLEMIIYGDVKVQAKFHAPLAYEVIPGATFTMKDKFYLDRLIQEVILLRQRVQELEAAAR